MFARMSRYDLVAGGTTRHQDGADCHVTPQALS
jgi:hypothetical protein